MDHELRTIAKASVTNPQLLFGTLFTLSLIISAMVAKWYIVLALNKLPRRRWRQCFSFTPCGISRQAHLRRDRSIRKFQWMQWRVSPTPILALIAVVFLRYGWFAAVAVAWVINVITSLDWLYAGYLAASNQLVTYRMGGNWCIINYYLPVIGVIHVMIFARLLKGR